MEKAVGEERAGTSARYLAPPVRGESDAWGAESAAGGRRGTQRIVRAGEVVAPDRVADLLQVERGGRIVERRRIMYLDGEPCELTDTYYPLEIARGTGLAAAGRIRGGAIRLLADLGYAGVRAQEDVVARMPSEGERASLSLEAGEPVLELTRLTLGGDDRPIQADVMVMSPRGQNLRYEIRIG
ncbi:UTRA domain-containing protein [Streptomyces sp. NPDC086796]|uniref:UTRA domain-containing protein n=1 Tax=unclassified Streptomyces TaxID=2593676 RepID=UPI003805EE41